MAPAKMPDLDPMSFSSICPPFEAACKKSLTMKTTRLYGIVIEMAWLNCMNLQSTPTM
jgi:hypothetical protein